MPARPGKGRVRVQQVARNNVSLEVAEVTESIEVTSDAAMLATENVSVGTVIEELRIVDLPFNGRN